MHRAGIWGQGRSCHAFSPSAPLSPILRLFINPEALQTPSFWFLWRLHFIGVTDQITGHCDGYNLQALSPPQRSGLVRLKGPILWTLVCSPVKPVPKLRCLPKVTSLNTTRDILMDLSGNSKGFTSSGPETGKKTKSEYHTKYVSSYPCFLICILNGFNELWFKHLHLVRDFWDRVPSSGLRDYYCIKVIFQKRMSGIRIFPQLLPTYSECQKWKVRDG